MSHIEVLKQALEALEYPLNTSHEGFDVDMAELLAHRAIEFLRQAIATEESSATQEPVAWLITDEPINSLQVNSIQRLIDRARHAHTTDIKLRINGQDEWFEADWIKHLQRAHPQPKAEQEPVAILQRYPSKGLLTVDYTDEITEVQEGTWPLYTHPQPKAEQEPKLMLEKFREMKALLDDAEMPKQNTMTDDALKIIMETTMPVIDWKARYGVELNNGERNKWMLEWFIAFARAIEAAHGIKGEA